MINKGYHPDCAHLPNEQDKKNWRNGGSQKHLLEQAKLKDFMDKWKRLNK